MISALVIAALAPAGAGREVAPAPWPVEYVLASDVRRLTPEQAAEGRPVKLVGVITYVNPHIHDGFLQDGSSGIYLWPNLLIEKFRAGDRVEIRGRTHSGDFASCVRLESVRRVGSTPLPVPLAFDLSADESRWLDSQFVECWGVIEEITTSPGMTVLTIKRGERRGQVCIPGEKNAATFRRAVTFPIRVRGVCVPRFDVGERRVLDVPLIFCPGVPGVGLRMASSGPEPLSPLPHLYRYSPGPSLMARRVRVEGTVVGRAGPNALVIQDGSAGATVRTVQPTDVAVGTRVQVQGYLEFDGRRAVLSAADVTPVGNGPLPDPVAVEPRDLDVGTVDTVRVKVGGRVVKVGAAADGVVPVMVSDVTNSCDVLLPAGVPPPAVGATVSAVGAATLWHPAGSGESHLNVAVAAGDDFAVLAEPPPESAGVRWTTRQIAAGCAVIAAAALAATAWLVLLRRTVRRQTAEMKAAFDREAVLQEQLRQSQKLEAVGRLAGGIAHDFNNLLTVINGCSELLSEQFTDGHPGKDLARDIRQAGDRAAGLTGQLLLFSRHRTVTATAVDLNAVVADVVKLISRVIPENISVVTEYVNLPPVRADAGLLHQVLVNLVLNSRDAMPGGGTLTIRTAIPDEKTGGRLIVEDTGSGMDAATQARVFEPFFTTKEVGQGTGLGLATVYGIVQALGGEIRFASTVGVGTTFEVDFAPAGSGKLPRPPLVADSKLFPAVGRRGRILLVEDDDGVRLLARRVLEAEGYRVTEAATPAAALAAAAAAERFDLLLTDVVMPEMNGRELAAQILGTRPAVRVLYMSGYTPDEVLRQGVLANETEFLSKPFTPARLLAAVSEVLGESPVEPRTPNPA